MQNIYESHNPEMFKKLFADNMQQQVKKINFGSPKNKELKNWIESELKEHLNELSGCTMVTKIYWIINGITDLPHCKYCEKQDGYIGKNVKSLKHGYFKYCSKACARRGNRHAISEALIKIFSEKKDEIIEKRISTCLKKYGVKNPVQAEEIKHKIHNTNMLRYGGQPAHSEVVREKMKQTSLKRYGYTGFNHKKQVETLMKKYGVVNVSQLPKVRNKIIKTLKKKYGNNISHPIQADEVKQKMKNTMLEKYGVDNASKRVEAKKYLGSGTQKKSYEKYILNNEFDQPMFTFEEYQNRKSDNDMLQFKCKKCGNIFFAKHYSGHHKHCEICYPPLYRKTTSNEENQLTDLIHKICNCTVLQNTKQIVSPFELDIFVPEKKIAFEFNGNYWHSVKQKHDKMFHLNKTIQCENKNIELVHIFENQWRYNKQLVENMLKLKLNKITYSGNIQCEKCDYKNFENFILSNSIYDVNVKFKQICFKIFSNEKMLGAIFGYVEQNVFHCMFISNCNFNTKSIKDILNNICNQLNINQIKFYENKLWNIHKKLFAEIGMIIISILSPKSYIDKQSLFIEDNSENCIFDCGYDIFSFERNK